jgi:hypothetical protein
MTDMAQYFRDNPYQMPADVSPAFPRLNLANASLPSVSEGSNRWSEGLGDSNREGLINESVRPYAQGAIDHGTAGGYLPGGTLKHKLPETGLSNPSNLFKGPDAGDGWANQWEALQQAYASDKPNPALTDLTRSFGKNVAAPFFTGEVKDDAWLNSIADNPLYKKLTDRFGTDWNPGQFDISDVLRHGDPMNMPLDEETARLQEILNQQRINSMIGGSPGGAFTEKLKNLK